MVTAISLSVALAVIKEKAKKGKKYSFHKAPSNFATEFHNYNCNSVAKSQEFF